MIFARMSSLNGVSILLLLLLCPAYLAAQGTADGVCPTDFTVKNNDPNYAYCWAQWLNDQMPQAVPEETIGLGGVVFGTPTPAWSGYFPPGWSAYECGGLHMTWAHFPTMQATPPAFNCKGVPADQLYILQRFVDAPVVQINSYNERYQIFIATPDNLDLHDLQVVLTVPTLGGSESFTASLEQSISPTGLGPGQNLGEGPGLIGGILATIAFHPRTSLPQTLRIWSKSAGVEGDYTIVPYLKPQLGGFVVPYLPVTIVYQPIGCDTLPTTNPNVPSLPAGSSAIFTTTAQVGTTFSWGNFNTSGTVQTDSSGEFFEHVKDGTDFAAFVAGVIPGGQSVAAALETVGKVVEGLNKILPNTQTTVTSTNTKGHSETQGFVISSSQGYGTQLCDPEDRYVYMRNVLFAFAVVPKDPVSKQFTPTGIPTVILAPIHFDAPVKADLLSDLKRNVPPEVLAQFLALRVRVAKQIPGGINQKSVQNLNPVLGSNVGSNVGFDVRHPRLVLWPPETDADINESVMPCYSDAPNYVEFGKQGITSYEASQATTITTVKKVSGLIATWMGQAHETTQSLTITGAMNNWQSYGTDSKVTLECPEIARISGPGAPSVGISSISRLGSVVSVTTSSAHGLPAGARVFVSGVADSSYNGLFQIANVPSSTTLTYNQSGTNSLSSGGSLTGGYYAREMDVWFDTLMGTLFVVPNGNLVPYGYGQQPQIHGISSPNTAVVLKIGGKRYSVLSDANGRFAFRFTSIPKGSGVLVAGNRTLQISYSGLPLPNDFRIGAGVATTSDLGTPRGGASLGNVLSPVTPCCPITSIDAAHGVATARVNSTGQSFQFAVKDAALLHSLKVGQGIFANFKTRQVSLDGRTACCAIVNFAPAPLSQPPTAKAPNLTQFGAPPKPPGPSQPSAIPQSAPVSPNPACCSITSIDAAAGVVTAQVNATGQLFEFKVTNQALLKSLKVGQAVYANFKTHQVSLNGRDACCPITSLGQTGNIPPIVGANPGNTAKVGGTPLASAEVQRQFETFRQRVQLLAPKLQSANLAEAQKANAEWKNLVTQINQWATQNNIATEAYRQPAGGGGGGGGGPTGGGTGSGSGSGSQTSCAPEKFSGPFWCILQGVGKDANGAPVCVYQCYKIFH